MTTRTTVLQKQFPPEVKLLRLLQFRRAGVRDDGIWNRVHVGALFRPADAQKTIALGRRSERSLHTVGSLVDLHRLAYGAGCGRIEDDRIIDLQLDRTAQFFRLEKIVRP